MNYAPMFEIASETYSIPGEVILLRIRYPKILIAPLFYILEDNPLCFIKEK